jgi:hypothetical protein
MSEQPRAVTGGCLCGHVRYEAEAFVDSAFYCHCSICRHSSGQPADIGVPVKPDTLRFTRGGPKFYKSSDWLRRGFCQHCGSRLVNIPSNREDQWATNLAVGSLDDPTQVRPYAHIFSDTQLRWFDPDAALPHRSASEFEDAVQEMKVRLGVD